MNPLALPLGYTRIQRVQSFDELVSTPLIGGVNALCWTRAMQGDFGAVISRLGPTEGITAISDERLQALRVTIDGHAAINEMLADLRQLRGHGFSPELNCILGYPRDEDPAGVSTDVYSFHADSATAETETFLCTYHGAPSEGLRNDEAVRHVDHPPTRARLRQLFGDGDDAAFDAFLRENCYDLHYAPLSHARPFSFGLGNLWRIAVDYPGSAVPPCLHRAPDTLPGQPTRLLLIS